MAEPVPALYWANLLRPNTPEEAPLSLPKLEGDQEQDTATWSLTFRLAAGIGCAAMACIPPAAEGEPTAVQGETASERRKAWARLLAMNPDH